jgi:hypothetical protein
MKTAIAVIALGLSVTTAQAGGTWIVDLECTVPGAKIPFTIMPIATLADRDEAMATASREFDALHMVDKKYCEVNVSRR